MIQAFGLGIEHRGKDATGLALVGKSGNVRVVKEPIAATEFFKRRQGIGMAARVGLIHTRAATQGSPKQAGNNHPIEYEGIVGIHNGIVYNDDEIFRDTKWFRQHQVDSEAIFASLYHKDLVKDALEVIDGSYAVAWLDRDNPFQLNLARGHSSPVYWGTTVNGSAFFASTEEVVLAAMKAAGIQFPDGKDAVEYITKLDEGQIVHINNGEITWGEEFTHDGSKSPHQMVRRKWTPGAYATGMYSSMDAGWDLDWDRTNYRSSSFKAVNGATAIPLGQGSEAPLTGMDAFDAEIAGIRNGDVLECSLGGETIYGEVTGLVHDTGEVCIDFGEHFIDLFKVNFKVMKGA